VLATNVASNIDAAFLRRIHVVVEFTMPQADERHRIWLRSLPPGAPIEDGLDLRRLANEIEVTGGTIRNVATRAAFLAVEQDSPITMELILVALQRELEKLGRLVSASEWRRLFSGPQSPPRP
jgi:ATP-dependent 26S proteasome regulatory subunit